MQIYRPGMGRFSSQKKGEGGETANAEQEQRRQQQETLEPEPKREGSGGGGRGGRKGYLRAKREAKEAATNQE